MRSQFSWRTPLPMRPRGSSGPGLASLHVVGAGFAAAGALFIGWYTTAVVHGLVQGRDYDSSDVATSALARGGLTMFSLALLLLAASLFAYGWSLRAHAPRLAVVCLLLSASGAFPIVANLVLLSGLVGVPRHEPGLTHAVLTNLATMVMVSLIVLRRRLLPRRTGLLLLVAGVVTFPCILLTIPLESVLPDYLIGDLPFAAWGAALIAVGWSLRRLPRA